MADEGTLQPYLKNIFLPEYLGSFLDSFKEVNVLYFSSKDREPTTITLFPFPFMRLYDLKILIYQHFRKEISAHPSFQCLLLPTPQLVEGNNGNSKFELQETVINEEYSTFEYAWSKPESSNQITLLDPFTRASEGSVDTNFVTESGKKTNTYIIRSRMILEDFTTMIDRESLTVHLFLYKDVVSGLRSELRSSEREWFGRIAPYFPDLAINQSPTSLPTDLQQRATLFDTYVTGFLQHMDQIQELLESETVPLLPMVVAGVKFLRLVWKAHNEDQIPLETMFYKTTVTHERPFLRILPASATAITKLKMDSTFKIPDLSDPRLLRIWKEERNPKPDKDFLFSKLIIRPTVGSQPALYGTLRIYDDNSADFLIIPPKQLRILDPRSDLSALGSLLEEGLKGLPFSKRLPEIGEASVICAIRLPLQQKLHTKETLRKRVAFFQPLFQEIPPLPGDNPLLMLRYKAVSNYAIEDRYYTFLTLMVTRTLAKGEAAIPELVVALAKEFQLTQEEAQSKVISWLRNRGDIQLAAPETKDYIMTYNPGIDIAIFAQQSYYTIHLYRVDSKKVFDRIVTAVSLLLSAKERDLFLDPAAAAAQEEVATAATVAEPGAALPEAGRAAVGLLDPPANAALASVNDDDALNSANMGDDMYLDLMRGGPVAQGNNENGSGEGEIVNLGDVINLNRGSQASSVNVEERVANNSRALGAAAASALAAERPPARVANAPPPPEAEEEEEEVVTAGKKKQSYQGWVKSQLQAVDQRLFQYSTDVVGRKIKKYVTMCQATESRQPYVLTQEQYDVMRETYAEDADVVFVVYPLEAGEPLPEAGDEVYTLLKYGTNPLKQNYYMCCQFFCVKDYIMVREKDFYSTTDRKGNPKPGESAPGKKDKGSCPFCHRLEIKVLKSPAPNESVIQRRSKKAESKRHLYVGFLQGETQHPEEFYMPCCFTEDSPLYITDPRFDKVRGEEKEEEEVRTTVGVPTTSYQITMYRAHKKYIVGPEKEYLKISEIDGPQIGLVPPVLDKYFAQDPKDYVSREANKMELLPNANCFLRMGVENRSSQRHDSFFSALAPYLDYRNTAESVKERIREVVSPRVFTFLNYGNLVLEFYDPGDPGPTPQELRAWVSRELAIDLNATNQDAAMRIWKSYHHFLGFLDSPQLKEYRQFAQMLALPGLVAPRGLILIVLELNGKGELSVRCPPFGYNIEQYSSSDIAFILHRSSGIWEPLFYSANRAQTARFKARHQPEITFQRALEAGWPTIVKQRVSEFTKQCRSIGRGAYTSSRRIDPMALVPLSTAIQSMAQPATGVVRDAYNHVVAITYRAKAGKPGLVALPVIDDEFIAVTRTLHLDWDDYPAAPMDQIVQFYRENFEQIFSLYPGYKIKRRIKSRGTERYVALQLANGLYIPASPPKEEAAIASLPLAEVDEMEWRMNREIAFGTDKEEPEESVLKAKETDMLEIFEHLRLTFSNWFSSEAVSGEFRTQIKKIIDSQQLPLFEKRKRLEILLGPEILSWMDTETPKGDQEPSLLRADCRLEAKAPCPARCVWRQSSNESVGRCYLHSPKEFKLGGRLVNGPQLLMLRLLEELLRFPERRQQLVKGTVTTLATLKEAMKIGEQYILPESSLAWQDLLRMDWVKTSKERKLFYEEMSRKEGVIESETKEEEPLIQSTPLPESLVALFGAEDPKTAKLFLLSASVGPGVPPLNPYLVPLGTDTGELGVEEDSTTLTRDAVKRLALITRRPIVYIDTVYDPPEVFSFGPLRKQKTPVPIVLVASEEGIHIVSSSRKVIQHVRPEEMPAALFELYEDRIGITE
jgi:hypothetical protein